MQMLNFIPVKSPIEFSWTSHVSDIKYVCKSIMVGSFVLGKEKLCSVDKHSQNINLAFLECTHTGNNILNLMCFLFSLNTKCSHLIKQVFICSLLEK